MITNDTGIIELKHFILRELCRLTWEDRLSPEETEKYLKFDWEMYPESLSGFDEMANGIIGGGEDEDQ